ncbi:hypothetical protein BZG75_14470 [Salinivibrio sp. AR640]|nr:hypothetical protein BZG75_14470 [Salinivibrio sp. AR640]
MKGTLGPMVPLAMMIQTPVSCQQSYVMPSGGLSQLESMFTINVGGAPVISRNEAYIVLALVRPTPMVPLVLV